MLDNASRLSIRAEVIGAPLLLELAQ